MPAKKKSLPSLEETFYQLRIFLHLKIDGYIYENVSFLEYRKEMENLSILYRGNKDFPAGKDLSEFAAYQNSFPQNQLPLTLIELFRRFKHDQKAIIEGKHYLYNKHYS